MIRREFNYFLCGKAFEYAHGSLDVALPWVYDQMYVIWHHYKCYDLAVSVFSSCLDFFEESPAVLFMFEDLLSVEHITRDEVQCTGHVPVCPFLRHRLRAGASPPS